MSIRGLRNFRFENFYGGLHEDFADDKINKNSFSRSDNFVLRKLGPEKAHGWTKLTDQILTDGEGTVAGTTNLEVRFIDEYAKKDGTTLLICLTNSRPYFFDETTDLWIPFYMPNYSASTVIDTAPVAVSDTVINVTDASSFSVDDAIILSRNSAVEEIAIVQTVSTAPTPDQLQIRNGVTNGHAVGASVEKIADSITTSGGAAVGGSVSTTVDQDSSSGTNVLYVAATAGIAANDKIIVNRGGAREEEASISSVSAGVSFTLSGNLTYTHTAAQADAVERLSTIDVPDGTIYAEGEEVLVGWGTADQEYMIVDSIVSNMLILDRPSWAPSGLGLQAAKAQYDLVMRVASCTYTTSTEFNADLNDDNYFFGSDAVEVQKFTNSSITTGAPAAGTTASLVSLCGDAERAAITGNAGLRTCEGLSAGDLCTARFMRTFEGFLVLGHVTEAGTDVPQKIRWSRYQSTANWANNADGSGQAGYFTFDGADFIMGLHQLKRELLVYRERSIEGMTYIGYPNIFGFRRAETGTGLLAPGAIVDFGDTHIFCGPDNIWQYDGVSLRAIGDPIKEAFFDTLVPSNRTGVRMYYIEENDEVLLSYSSTDNAVHDVAYSYNVVLNQWSGPRDVDAMAYGWYDRQATTTWNTSSGNWDDQSSSWGSRIYLANNPINLMGNDDGLVFILGEVGTADGSTMTGTFETKLTDCGIPQMNKRLLKVRIGARQEGSYDHNIYVGAADYPGEDLTWYGPYTVGVDSNDQQWVPVDVRARLFKIRLETTVNFANLRDIELFFRPGGWV